MAQATNTPTYRHEPIAYVWEDNPNLPLDGEHVPLHGPMTAQMSRFTKDRLIETLLCLYEVGIPLETIGDLMKNNTPGRWL